MAFSTFFQMNHGTKPEKKDEHSEASEIDPFFPPLSVPTLSKLVETNINSPGLGFPPSQPPFLPNSFVRGYGRAMYDRTFSTPIPFFPTPFYPSAAKPLLSPNKRQLVKFRYGSSLIKVQVFFFTIPVLLGLTED